MSNNPFMGDIFPAGDATDDLKRKFAEALLRNPDQSFLAAQEVFGSDTGRALYASQNWLADDLVREHQTVLLKSKGARAFLPSKEDYAREVWRLAQNDRTPIEDKRYLFSLFGDIMGYKTQAEKGGLNVNITQNRVMIVRDHGTNAEWEKAAQAQQHALQQGAAIDVPARVIQ